MNGCVTKGTGCIESSAQCASYVGVQTTCAKFKGNSTTICWNTKDATETTPCKAKACTDKSDATTDAECDAFMPKGNATNPICITNGAGCVNFG